MPQVNTLQSFTGAFRTQTYSSLNDMIMSISGEGRPLTLRQVANRGYYDIDTVTAALQETIRNGVLATFKIGPLNYYASPYSALTSKGPTFSNVADEVFRNALWEGKRMVKAMTEKFSPNSQI